MKSSECEWYKSKEICETCDLPNKTCAYRDYHDYAVPILAEMVKNALDGLILECLSSGKEIPNNATFNITQGKWEY